MKRIWSPEMREESWRRESVEAGTARWAFKWLRILVRRSCACVVYDVSRCLFFISVAGCANGVGDWSKKSSFAACIAS